MESIEKKSSKISLLLKILKLFLMLDETYIQKPSYLSRALYEVAHQTSQPADHISKLNSNEQLMFMLRVLG